MRSSSNLTSLCLNCLIIYGSAKGKYGLKDYEKVFHATQDDNIYDLRSIDKDKGCIVIVRPDQHIAALLPLTAHEELSAFFDVFMRVPSLP